MTEGDLLLREYREINDHLRSNLALFVNWFSLTLLLAFIGVAIAACYGTTPGLLSPRRTHATEVVLLLLHILAFIGIFTFRRYIAASHRRIEEIAIQCGGTARSPIPLRFCQWMTDLMAAGYVLSYFSWFAILLLN